ncbi:MAG TPA: hypothetical protein VNW54_02240 [Granulicella sp.]|nr:hypothetical protein [Granulicella sp.]
MATIAVGRFATVANEVEPQSVEPRTVETPVDSAARTEVDVLARALCAVSLHSSLTDALLSFYHSLKPEEAQERSTQVLERMQKILPHDLAEDLAEACNYDRPWAWRPGTTVTDKRSLAQRFALPAIYLVGGTMLALSIVGAITVLRSLMRR